MKNIVDAAPEHNFILIYPFLVWWIKGLMVTRNAMSKMLKGLKATRNAMSKKLLLFFFILFIISV